MDSTRLPLSIVFPVYNEAQMLESAIGKVIADLLAIEPHFEIVLSQNGSTDGTCEVIERLARRYSCIRVIHSPVANYGFALKRGFLTATGEWIVNFSVDWIDLDFLRASLALSESCDLVLGSKHLSVEDDRRPWLRRYGGRTFHWLTRKLFALPVRDSHGIKAHRADRLRPIIERCHYGAGLFETELVMRAYRAGLKLQEIPLEVHETRPSRRSVAGQALQALRDMMRLRVRLWREGSQPIAAGKVQPLAMPDLRMPTGSTESKC